MKHDGAYVVLVYSGSEVFGNDDELTKYLGIMSDVKASSPKIKTGKLSVDNNKWIVGHFDIWPIPGIYYFPISTKTAETIINYAGKDLSPDAISRWADE